MDQNKAFQTRCAKLIERDSQLGDEYTRGKIGTERVYGTPTFASLYEIIHELNVGETDTLIDIGSGVGNVLFVAESLVPVSCQLHGIELQLQFHEEAERRKMELKSRAQFEYGDITTVTKLTEKYYIPNRLVIFCFDVEFPTPVRDHIYKLAKEFPGPCTLISCFNHDQWTPMESKMRIGINKPPGSEYNAQRYDITTTFLAENHSDTEALEEAEQGRQMRAAGFTSVIKWAMRKMARNLEQVEQFLLFRYEKAANIQCQVCASTINVMQCPCKQVKYCGIGDCQAMDWEKHSKRCTVKRGH
jgi:Histone methylation protein DOT1